MTLRTTGRTSTRTSVKAGEGGLWSTLRKSKSATHEPRRGTQRTVPLVHTESRFTLRSVSAGSDQTVLVSDGVTLTATIAYAGHQHDLTILWTATGPGTVTFSNAYADSTTATVSVYGEYEFTITVTSADGVTVSDSLTVYAVDDLHVVFSGAITTDQRPPVSGVNATVVGGTTISSWQDSSGNGNHYTNGTVAVQPLYRAGLGPNGLNYAAFEPADRLARNPLAQGGVSGNYAGLWALLRVNDRGASGVDAIFGTGESVGVYSAIAAHITDQAVSWRQVTPTSIGTWPAGWFVLCVFQDGTDRVCTIDGVEVVRVSGLAALTSNQVYSQISNALATSYIDVAQFMFTRGTATPTQAEYAARYLMHVAGLP